MNDGPVSIGYLIVVQIEQLVMFLPVALLAIWLLRARWLRHITPSPVPKSNLLRRAAIGIATAIIGLSLSIVPALFSGSYSPAAPGWQAFHYEALRNDFASVGGLALLFAVQSLFEEALFRGIGIALLAMLLMKAAELLMLPAPKWKFGSSRIEPDDADTVAWRRRAWLYCGLLANLVLSVGFALMHSRNPNVSPIALLNIMLAGLWLGLLFWRRIGLLTCWLAHFVWNLGLALLGLPVSGFALYQDPLGPMGIDGARADLLSGGAFGPEASIPAALAFGGMAALLLWQLLRQSSAAAARREPTGTDHELRTG